MGGTGGHQWDSLRKLTFPTDSWSRRLSAISNVLAAAKMEG